MRERYDVIGETAGKIYHTLAKNGPTTDAALKKEIGVPDAALFNQAIGWLAREEKINFEKMKKDGSFRFCLNLQRQVR